MAKWLALQKVDWNIRAGSAWDQWEAAPFPSPHTYHCVWYCFSTSLTLHIPLLPVLFLNFTHFIHTAVASTVSQFNSLNTHHR